MCVPNAVIGSESGSGGDYFGTALADWLHVYR